MSGFSGNNRHQKGAGKLDLVIIATVATIYRRFP